MIDEMARALPNYEDFFDLFQSDQRLHHALVLVYEDILGFWGQATKIFAKSRNTGTSLLAKRPIQLSERLGSLEDYSNT